MFKKILKKLISKKFISRIISSLLWILPSRLRVRIGGALNTSLIYKRKQPYDSKAYPQGINLFGYLKAQMGLGQGVRLIAHAIIQSGLPCTFLNVSVGNPAQHTEKEFEALLAKAPLYNTNIVHINPEQIPLLHQLYSARAWDKRYNIAVWLWELEEFPEEWHSAFRCFDEIWTPSTFTSASIAKSTSLPVITIPYGIHAEAAERFDRRYFKLPEDRFLFLCMYDVNSTMERKNPIGAIDAFCSAFSADSTDVGLVVKINNATPENLSKLMSYIGQRQNVFVISKLMGNVEVQSLIKACDVFLSLHRSEGFGLVMAEAMFLGVPAIATNWSANTDFMKANNSCLVDFSFTDVKNQYYKSRQGQRWANPDNDHAAEYMRQLHADQALYARIAKAGQDYIRSEYSIERSAQKMLARLHDIGVVSR